MSILGWGATHRATGGFNINSRKYDDRTDPKPKDGEGDDPEKKSSRGFFSWVSVEVEDTLDGSHSQEEEGAELSRLSSEASRESDDEVAKFELVQIREGTSVTRGDNRTCCQAPSCTMAGVSVRDLFLVTSPCFSCSPSKFFFKLESSSVPSSSHPPFHPRHRAQGDR